MPIEEEPEARILSLEHDFKSEVHESLLSRLFPPYCGSSSDTVFGIRFYGHKNYEKWWFRLTIGVYHDYVLQSIDSVYWWIHHRFIFRHHIVRTDLRPGWCDVDEVMFCACFALLGRFVEHELGIATVDYALEYGHYRGYRIHSLGGTDEAAIDLWHWYRYDLKKLYNEMDRDYHGFVKTHGRDFVENLKEEKLVQLMAMRKTLWT